MKKLNTIKVMLALMLLLMSFLIVGVQEAKSQIYEPEGLNMPGLDTWGNPPDNLAFASSTQVAGGRIVKIYSGTPRWQTIFSVAASGADVTPGNKTWLFTSGPTGNPWANKWAGVTVSTNTLQNYSFNTGADNTVSLTGNKWYTVVWEDSGYNNTRAIFMETSVEPVNITTVSEPTEDVEITQPYVVSITTSANPSAEERFYLRYTTNNWTNSQIVTFSMAGSGGTASISGQPDGTTVAYYVFSSTVPGITSNFDLYSIRINNKSGAFYSYQVGESSEPDTYIVKFNLDISPITDFNHATEKIYISGIPSWIEPGVDPNLALTRVGETDIYTIEFDLVAATYEYKFFRNASWEGGEWGIEIDNRSVIVTESIVVNDTWGDHGGGGDDPNYGIRDDDGVNLPTITYWHSGAGDDVTEQGVDFEGNNLGEIDALYVKGASIKTWKTSGGDVTGASLQYKVWEVGEAEPVSYITRNIGWTSNDNPEETLQTWASFGTEIDVLVGLTEGTYNLKIFFRITGTGNPGTTTDGPYIATFVLTEDIPDPDEFPVTFTVTNNNSEVTSVYIKGLFNDWAEELMNNTEANIWTATFNVLPGTYEWGVADQDSEWLLPPMTNLEFTVDATGNVTGTTTYTIEEGGGGGDDPNYGIRDDDGANLPTITYWHTGEIDDITERGVDFDSNNLGIIEALYIKGAAIKTWKEAGGDVTGADFQYKVWKNGDSEPGTYTTRNLGWTSNDNPEETFQTWAGFGDEINVLSGLTEGIYSLKIFFSITGTGIPGETSNGPFSATFNFELTSPEEPEIVFANLQYPGSASINVGGSIDVLAQVEVENADIDPTNGVDGLLVWIGYSNSNSNPSIWTNWVAAFYNGINEYTDRPEYQGNIGSEIIEPGTYFYASRFKLNDEAYVYGGYNVMDGGFWNGTTNVSGVLTVNQSAITFPVSFTVTNNNMDVTEVYIKGEFNEWTDVLMDNASGNVWESTFYIPAGTYEWGVSDQNLDWLLPQFQNLEFTIDAEGNITGETTYTIPPTVYVELISNIKPNIYPNPARNYFIIEMDWNNAGLIRILDVSGKIVVEKTVSNEADLKFNVSGFRQGFYFVEINTNDGRVVLPLVVNK
jgi:hypothetical protein